MRVRLVLWILLASLPALGREVMPDRKNLPIGLAPHEVGRRLAAPEPSAAPVAPIRSLGEWEEARAAMTLWSNPSLVRALADRGKVILIADGPSGRQWWRNWLERNGIAETNVSYFLVPTDSIWIRDYGPWPIVDGLGRYGLVHNTYNRPRPQDDRVAEWIARELSLPFFDTGLVHTGGNYYSDGLGNAFSSTLVYTENRQLSQADVRERMLDFLGIDRYTTSKLAPGITIEHIDTFGKLVAPDTWVWSDFPAGSRYRADSEAMHALLKTLKSPYGTPYRIHRLKMTPGPGGQEFRAWLNAFISNGALYYPTYGNDAADQQAKRVYEAALPGYEIVGVDAGGTSWGDSVHCRNRNLIEWDTLFLFPRVERITGDGADVVVETAPSPGAVLEGAPELLWRADQGPENRVVMDPLGGGRYGVSLRGLAGGARVSFHVSARDSRGKRRRVPHRAPSMTIDFTVGGSK